MMASDRRLTQVGHSCASSAIARISVSTPFNGSMRPTNKIIQS